MLDTSSLASKFFDQLPTLPLTQQTILSNTLWKPLLHPLYNNEQQTSINYLRIIRLHAPVGVSCWLCLEEGPDDESGAPLVRDCSCRGHSGFAHLPCLVKYAERKSKDLIEKGMCKITDMLQEKIFEQCPNCKQAFQGNLYYDLTKAQLSFVERDFKDLQGWYLGTLIRRIAVVDGGDEGDRAEGEEICAKMLSLIDDMKKMSDPSLCSAVLANVYQYIGLFNFKVGTHRCLEKAKYYMEKARDAISTSGDREGQSLPAAFESMIDTIEAILRGESPTQNTASDLINLRERYNFLLRFIGEGSVDTIETFAKGA